MPAWYQWQGNDLVLSLHIQPGADRDRLDGCHGDRLKIRISAPPADGRANTRLVKFLATLFGVPRRQVELLSGQGSRRKRVRMHARRACPTSSRHPADRLRRLQAVIRLARLPEPHYRSAREYQGVSPQERDRADPAKET